jgi:hypothetical protein
MKTFSQRAIFIGIAVAAIAGGAAYAAQDKYTVVTPNGLGFEEFRGYEGWQVVSASQNADKIEVIVSNPIMIKAFEEGAPENGKPFPDGSRMAKFIWTPKTRTDMPVPPVVVPDKLKTLDFMVKDSKRFTGASGGWGYAVFDYDNAAQAFKPASNDAKCGVACHTAAKKKDYVFTDYAPR